MLNTGYFKYFLGVLTTVLVITGTFLAIKEPEKYGNRLFELLTVSVTGLFALANPKPGE